MSTPIIGDFCATTAWFAYVRKSPAEIEQLAWDIVAGKVFGSWDVPRDQSTSVAFLALLFLTPELAAELQRFEIVHCYNYLEEAGPRSINGLPCFAGHHWLDKHDTALVQERVDQLIALRRQREAETAARSVP